MSYNDLEASDKQYALMDKLGIEYAPEGVSMGEARALIEAKIGKKPKDITNQYQGQGVSGLSPILSLDKDTLIVRQSCLKASAESWSQVTGQMTEERIKGIISLAEEFEKWVFR